MDPTGIGQEKYITLTTKGRKTGKLHTVELWFANVEGKLYLSHEGKDTDWMKNILKDDYVEFRIGEIRWKGRARIVRGGEAFERGKQSLYLKYYGRASMNVIDDWFSESTIVEVSMIESMY